MILPSFASKTALGAVPVCFEPSRRALMRRVINSLAVLVLLLSADGLSANANGAGEAAATYVNPVGGDLQMGDPFVMLHKGQYYLYGTTASDGFKCWTSLDLVHWKPRGYAYQRREGSWGGKTYWAPEVIFHAAKYYMVFSCQRQDSKSFSARICLAVGQSPEGPFVDLHAPLFDNGWSCIDGHIFVDDDSTPYLYFSKVGSVGEPWKKPPAGYLYGMIYCVKLARDLSAPIGDPVLCLQADQPWEHPDGMRTRCNEGAFVLKHGAVYYMTYSANHYADPDYGIGYATARAPLGPWTKCVHNPIVAKNLDLAVSGPGHCSITTSPDGAELFMVYHAHADVLHPSGRRTVNIDRLVFQEDGTLTLIGPTRSPQPMPSGYR